LCCTTRGARLLISASHEKDEDDHREEDVFIIYSTVHVDQMSKDFKEKHV
jgi:hypothetical protein